MTRAQFPFDREKYFVGEENSADCVPACAAMCAKYWNDKIPSLKLSTTNATWVSYFDKLNIHSPRGTNTSLLNYALKRLKPKNSKVYLKADLFYPDHLNDLTKLFELDPPFPVILTYDKRMVEQVATGVTHASLFHSMDIQKDKVYLIDPARVYVKDPYPYDKNFFLRGWEVTGNETIIIHPSNVRIPINTMKRIKHDSMNGYTRSSN